MDLNPNTQTRSFGEFPRCCVLFYTKLSHSHSLKAQTITKKHNFLVYPSICPSTANTPCVHSFSSGIALDFIPVFLKYLVKKDIAKMTKIGYNKNKAVMGRGTPLQSGTGILWENGNFLCRVDCIEGFFD